MNLGMPEMIFIFLLALVIFGPRKLPELGRQLGKVLAEFKRASNEFRNQLETEMANIELEERVKKIPDSIEADSSHTILPGEKLYETTSAPPGVVSRGYLEQAELPPGDGVSGQTADPAPIEPEVRPNSSPASSNA
jgi:Tat protein translocase TatB subunit